MEIFLSILCMEKNCEEVCFVVSSTVSLTASFSHIKNLGSSQILNKAHNFYTCILTITKDRSILMYHVI